MDDNQPSFQEIYADFQPKILRYLTRLVGESDAEDLTQEVFVKVSQALGGFKGESRLSTWIYRIATNVAFDRLRSPVFKLEQQTCSPAYSLETDEMEIADSDAWTGEKLPLVEQQIFRKEMNACLLSFIMRLPEDYRTVLLLSEYEGLSNSEIAEVLDITLDTVKIRLHRGRERLKEELAANCDSYWVEDNEFIPELKLA
jgi:RNA polymerase sigma-70 factor (ECF subfamily)